MPQDPIVFPSPNEAGSESSEPLRKTKPSPKKPAPKKIRPQRILPSERIAFTRQLDILRAYVAASGPSGNPVKVVDVAKIVRVVPQTVSLMNSFLLDTGLITRNELGFVPSNEAVNYVRAHEWNPETATQKLAPLIERTWFAEVLLPKISFSPLKEDVAIEEIAQSASAGPEYRSQIRVLLEYLIAAGLAIRDGEMLKKATLRSVPVSNDPQQVQSPDFREPGAARSSVATMFSQAAEGVVQFHITVKVSMSEFAAWKPERISAFFSGIAQVLAAKGSVEKEVSQG